MDRVELDGARALAGDGSVRTWPSGWTIAGEVDDDGWCAVVPDGAP